VVSQLDHPSVAHYHNQIGVLDGRQAVRYRDAGSARTSFVQGLLHDLK
jgi:hypothetical protein